MSSRKRKSQRQHEIKTVLVTAEPVKTLLPAWNQQVLPAVLLTVLCLIAYGNSLQNGFVWDDNYQIVRNPYVHGEEPLSKLLFTDVWGYTHPAQKGVSNYYRPLQMIIYRWTAQAAGLEPLPFHAVNLVFHIATTLIGYLLFCQLTGKKQLALLAAALFALHPIHTETVVWIASLPDLGSTLFSLLSFWWFLRILDAPRRLPSRQNGEGLFASRGLWAGSLAAFATATFFKEMALTVPLLVAAYVFIVPREPRGFGPRFWDACRHSLPYWVWVAVYALIRIKVLGFFSRVQHVWMITPIETILSAVYLAGKYWLKLFLPMQLNAFHTFLPVRSLSDPRLLASLAFLSVLAWFVVYYWRRTPLHSFLILWVFATLLPVFNIQGVGRNVFAERYLYVPSVGFCLAVVVLAGRLLEPLSGQKRRWVGATVLAAVSIFYLIQTVQRNRDWKDDFTLYARSVEASPESAQMRNSLADLLWKEKHNLAAAEQQYLTAIEVAQQRDPPETDQLANAYNGLGGIYVQRQQYEKAIEIVEKGAAYSGRPIEANPSYGVALMRVGRLDEARRILQNWVRYTPNDGIALNALGVIALAGKEYATSISYFQRSIRVFAKDWNAYNNLGRTYMEMGRFEDALPPLQQALVFSKNHPQVLANLGECLVALKRYDEARPALQRAVQLAPDYEPARAQLAVLEQLSKKTR